MNRILTLGLAMAGTALLSQPVYAGKEGRGGGGGARASAPAMHSAPHFSTHAIAPQHFAQRSAPMPHFNSRPAPMAHVNQFKAAPIARNEKFNGTPAARINPRTNFNPTVANARAGRNTPSVAFGGSVNQNAVVNGSNTRNFANTDPRGRGHAAYPVPGNVSRDWDRHHQHDWNHHRYGWYNGGWVLFDGGYPYGDGYPYGYDNGYYNDYGTEPPPAVMYDSSASIAASVQAALDQQGYNAGPADGVIGPQTRDALTDFQYANHLPVSGAIDDPTLHALGLR